MRLENIGATVVDINGDTFMRDKEVLGLSITVEVEHLDRFVTATWSCWLGDAHLAGSWPQVGDEILIKDGEASLSPGDELYVLSGQLGWE